jgi:hypothetical protein
VARAIPDERGNRTVLRREERQSRAIKSNHAPSRAIKRQQAPYRTPNQCSTMTSVSRFSYTRMSACQIRQPTIVGGNPRSAVKVRDSRALIRD